MTEDENLLLAGAAYALVTMKANHENQQQLDTYGHVPWSMRHRWLSFFRRTAVLGALLIGGATAWEDWCVVPIVKANHLYNPQLEQASNCGWAMFLFALPFLLLVFVWWPIQAYRRADHRWKATADSPTRVVDVQPVD